MNKIKNLLLYAGLSKEDFYNIRNRRNSQNRISLIIFSIIGFIGFFLLLLSAVFNIGAFKNNDIIYIVCTVLFLSLFFIILKFGNKSEYLISVLTYFFMAALLVYGIFLAVEVSPQERTVSFIVFMMALPGLFLISPLGYMILIFLAVGIFTFLISGIQEGDLFLVNFEDALIFGLLSIIIGTYLMYVKAARFNSEKIASHLISKDQLTGIYNRRNYELTLEKLKNTKGITVILFDVNGLKVANDKIGHIAGDELIRVAASCIDSVFGKFGKSYRIGGDEFVVILEGKYDLSSLLKEFDSMHKSWVGDFNKSLSISYGYVKAADFPEKNIYQLVDAADRLMYENKAEYYKNLRGN